MKKGNWHDRKHGSIGSYTRLGLDFQGPISEGKIKAGVPPCTLTPCLHIIFGVHPVRYGVNPFLAQSPVLTDVDGGAPFSKPSVYGGF